MTSKPTENDEILANMGSPAREADLMTRKGDVEKSTCAMVVLPTEIKTQIMSYLRTQESLSRLGQSCRAWYEVAIEELYKRDSRENNSFAIKWMAAHAISEQTTDSALRTLEISRRWGGQIDAIQRGIPRSDQDQTLDGASYKILTALHFAVLVRNFRLAKTLLEMKASLTIPCSVLLWRTMDSEQLLRRFRYFLQVFDEWKFGPVFPIYLAFLQSDPDMCKLLMEHGAGREAMIFDSDTKPKVMSILHFAAADPTTDHRQWKCLFDGFREYIDEPCPRRARVRPLHIALKSGCTQGMQIAVESGADKEARDGFSRTPLGIGVLAGIPYDLHADPTTFEEHTRCFRKFVELGANVNPEGDSVLVLAMQFYAPYPNKHPVIRHLISYLLDQHADIHATRGRRNTNVANEIIKGILAYNRDLPTQHLLKELLSDLVERGLNLTIPAPGFLSPLYRILRHRKAEPEWLFDLLCEKGTTIHKNEVNAAFLRWCEIPRLWRTNKYDAWWQHQGQEGEIFQKWCEHPYNVWWWQYVNQISRRTVTLAYGKAFKKSRQLYEILTHLPLAAPLSGLLVEVAFKSKQPRSWSLVVLREFEEDFVATWSHEGGENMIHLSVRLYVSATRYSAADAARDVLHLRDKGVNMISRNGHGQTPLELLLELGSCKDDFMELVAVLEGMVHK